MSLRTSYRLLAGGALTIDLGAVRRLQRLGPLALTIRAPPEVVFDIIASPYLGRTPRALAEKLQVWERGTDMVLAAHFTEVRCGITTTLETVRFQPPERIDFRLVRGPVPHLSESFQLTPSDAGSELRWRGELGTRPLGDRTVVGRPGCARMDAHRRDIDAEHRAAEAERRAR